MSRQQLVAQARNMNRDVIIHVKAGRMWAADLSADFRDINMKHARQAQC